MLKKNSSKCISAIRISRDKGVKTVEFVSQVDGAKALDLTKRYRLTISVPGKIWHPLNIPEGLL